MRLFLIPGIMLFADARSEAGIGTDRPPVEDERVLPLVEFLRPMPSYPWCEVLVTGEGV